jgi:EAL domain-containing protein (putative c-di-GMP-specific phosphodiesterase class I)
VALDIVAKMADPFDLEGDPAYVSASVGIAMYPDDAREIDTLFNCADPALYVAKDAGRNQHEFYSPVLQEAAQKRARLLNDLRGSLSRDELRLYYQPIVDMASGHVDKAEALIRWQHPSRGLINPVDFIPLAEESGLIVEIGDWVFREAAHQAADWRRRGNDLVISINVSPAQFQRNGTVSAPWLDYLSELGLPGHYINAEITEGLLLDASTTITDRLLAFRDAGIQVSLDDFGTGYSALSYLNKFDIDYLKIDQSFIDGLAPGSNNMALCEAIIVMAHKLGLKVVAEGVETTRQRDLLQAAGCDFAQGYLFSHPVPVREFQELSLHLGAG